MALVNTEVMLVVRASDAVAVHGFVELTRTPCVDEYVSHCGGWYDLRVAKVTHGFDGAPVVELHANDATLTHLVDTHGFVEAT